MSARILLVGTTHRVSSLKRNWDVTVVSSGRQAIQHTATSQFDLIIVDAVSMRTSGERVCKMIKEHFSDCPMIHIQPQSSTAMKVADVTLCPPFSSRKLLGVVHRLIENQYGGDLIHCGPFKLDPITRILFAHGQESQLNPKLADLLALFFANPNRVLDREIIMQEVWDTNYMGDTRTLDVHIRHARNVLENGNKKPQYLKTIRGIGYCLEIPNSKEST